MLHHTTTFPVIASILSPKALIRHILPNFGLAEIDRRFHIDLEHLIDKPLRNIRPFLSHRPHEWDYLQWFA